MSASTLPYRLLTCALGGLLLAGCAGEAQQPPSELEQQIRNGSRAFCDALTLVNEAATLLTNAFRDEDLQPTVATTARAGEIISANASDITGHDIIVTFVARANNGDRKREKRLYAARGKIASINGHSPLSAEEHRAMRGSCYRNGEPYIRIEGRLVELEEQMGLVAASTDSTTSHITNVTPFNNGQDIPIPE